jgi:hypothetical protein
MEKPNAVPLDLEKQCADLAAVAMSNGQGLLLLEAENRDLKESLRECLKAMERNGWHYKASPTDADYDAYKLAKKTMKGYSK